MKRSVCAEFPLIGAKSPVFLEVVPTCAQPLVQYNDACSVIDIINGQSTMLAQRFDQGEGDYFSMVVDVHNQTQMAFGEAPSYQGPGNQWVSHSVDD